MQVERGAGQKEKRLLGFTRIIYKISSKGRGDQSRYAGKQISEISLPNNALLIAIYNDDELMIPHGDTLIEAGQDILAFGDEQAIEKLNEIFVS